MLQLRRISILTFMLTAIAVGGSASAQLAHELASSYRPPPQDERIHRTSTRYLKAIEFVSDRQVFIEGDPADGSKRFEIWDWGSEPPIQTVLSDEYFTPGSVMYFGDTSRIIKYSRDEKAYLLSTVDHDGNVVSSKRLTTSLAFLFAVWSADRKRFAVRGELGEGHGVIVVDVGSARILAEFELEDEYEPQAKWMSLSHDGSRLVIGRRGSRDAVKVFDVDSGDTLATSGGFISSLRDVAISPDGRSVATLGEIGGKERLSIWNANILRPTTAQHVGHRGDQIVYFSDGRKIAVASGPAIEILDCETLKPVCELRGKGKSDDFSVSPDGRLVATLHGDSTVAVWNWMEAANFLTPMRIVRSHPVGDYIPRICYAPDGNTIAVSFATKNQSRSGGSTTASASVSARQEAADGAWITSGSRSRGVSVCLVDPDSGEPSGYLDLANHRHLNLSDDLLRTIRDCQRFMRLKFSPDASQLVAVSDSYGGVTAVWDVPDRRLKGIVAPGSGSIDFDFDPAGKSVAIVTTYGELYKVENLQQDYRRWKTTRLPGDFGRASIEYTPSGSALLSGLSIYDSAGGDPIFSSSEYNSESYDCLVCTADGQRAFAMYGSLVVCWDLGSGTCSYPFVFHRESTRVKTMDIALSGATLATAAADGIIRLWDINTHRLLVSLKGHQAAVASISFSPDGKKLVSIGYDGLTCFWDTAAYTNGENRDKTLAAPALPTLRKFDVKKGITVKVISEHGASDSEVRRALEAALEQVSN